ncbi:MAG: multicomponent K+:H+ antiporter subunit G [Limimaricola cinnabarinus]|jgi:multicomponent K+:H+ antiporter subunit G|uniref:Na+/H+ antiporter subunit G n=1 Tax=Limimaricola cinnabarinus TaxID=1125964 RepID=UPI0039E2ED13
MTDIPFLIDILVATLLIIGATFTLIGSYGLLKLDQPMKRLHAPTKASTLGVGSLLLASMIHAFASGEGSLHELLVMAFLFVTAPISGNFIAKVHLHRQRGGKELPAPPAEDGWATYSEK